MFDGPPFNDTRYVRYVSANPSAPPVSDTTLRLMARRRGLLARDGRTPAFLTLDQGFARLMSRESNLTRL